MGDIGPIRRKIDLEPIDIPVAPVEEPAPAEPQPEPVPA